MSSILKFEGAVWSLPLLFQYDPVYAALRMSLRGNGAGDIGLVNVFGAPACLWTGGRPPGVYGELTPSIICKQYEFIKSFSGIPTLAFTNRNITKEDLEDKYCNLIADITYDFGGHFIVYSELLYDYIKSKYPDAYMVSSVIKAVEKFQTPEAQAKYKVEEETEFYNKLSEKYEMVVTRPWYSKYYLPENPDVLKKPEKIEILINQSCIPNCPVETKHYSWAESKSLENNRHSFNICPRMTREKNILYPTKIHSDETVKKLMEHGYNHLKLHGRGVNKIPDCIIYDIGIFMLNTEGFGMIEDACGLYAEQTLPRFRREVLGMNYF